MGVLYKCIVQYGGMQGRSLVWRASHLLDMFGLVVGCAVCVCGLLWCPPLQQPVVTCVPVLINVTRGCHNRVIGSCQLSRKQRHEHE